MKEKKVQHANEGIKLWLFLSFLIAWILNEYPNFLENASIGRRIFVLQKDSWELFNILAFSINI